MLIAKIEVPPFEVEFPEGDFAWLSTVFDAHNDGGDGPTFLQGRAVLDGGEVDVLVNLVNVVLFADVSR